MTSRCVNRFAAAAAKIKGWHAETLLGIGLLAVITVAFFVGGISQWRGDPTIYAIFSLTFLALLISGITHYLNVGYFLLASILWTGYWLKMTLHLLEPGSVWVEPTGEFDFSATAWNEVALVASIGAAAVLVAGVLWRKIGIRRMTWAFDQPVRYSNSFRFIAWSTVIGLTIAVVMLNENFGIFHAGLRPSLDLPWPMRGLWGWLISIGVTLMVMVLFQLEVLAGRPLWLATALFVFASAALSVTSFSRGTYVLQTLPVVVVLIFYRRKITWLNTSRLFFVISIFVLGALVSIGWSQHRRAEALPHYGAYQLLQDFPQLLKRLSVERWVGLEGVMAISAYPDKSTELFLRAANERRDLDHVDLYTREISSSVKFDTARYHYATLPGSFAFLYYSGSLFVVFLGTLFMTWAVLGAENWIKAASDNPFLAAQVGMYATTLMIQLGAGGLIQPASVLIFSIAFSLALSKLSSLVVASGRI